MKKIQIKRRLALLQRLLKMSNSERRQYLMKCDQECINTICEACYNLLWNNFKFKKPKINKISKDLTNIKTEFKKISDPKIALKTKRQLLSKKQTGDGIFSILATTVIPALVSLLAKK